MLWARSLDFPESSENYDSFVRDSQLNTIQTTETKISPAIFVESHIDIPAREYFEPPTSTCPAELVKVKGKTLKQIKRPNSVPVPGRRPLRRVNLNSRNSESCPLSHLSPQIQSEPPVSSFFQYSFANCESCIESRDWPASDFSQPPSCVPKVVQHTLLADRRNQPRSPSCCRSPATSAGSTAAGLPSDPPRPPERTTSLPDWKPPSPSSRTQSPKSPPSCPLDREERAGRESPGGLAAGCVGKAGASSRPASTAEFDQLRVAGGPTGSGATQPSPPASGGSGWLAELALQLQEATKVPGPAHLPICVPRRA